jgi:putative transposase
MIAYKAILAGSRVIKVDADYASQTCPLCGYTSKQNRPGKGLLFVCQNKRCVYRLQTNHAYTLHADLIGARNIAMRTHLIRQDWVRTGVLEVSPDVSSDETKAARRARYAELRWSLDTSPSFQG